jgi:hypothetical protein
MTKSRYVPEIPTTNEGYIFRPWITTKDGRRIYAKDYGLTAFRILKRY